MRICVVSAHYPPNFTSGGTLVPQRIAQTLAARGHQVSVFAGEIVPGEPDLITRPEVTEDGIAVTWVSLSGFLGWGDEHNYRNTAIQARFLEFLRAEQPEVVHLHTLQGMGGSLVSTAAAFGAVTVVTMHDMWWWCSRQFLVTADMKPCSTVVECGVCPCSVDNGWLRRRNAELADQLSAADLVLAPSRPMVELLAANGVDPQRLALDENPSPDSVLTPVVRDPEPSEVVRFVFAGGRHPVKGGDLAVEAAGLLGDLPGWQLDLYGWRPDGGGKRKKIKLPDRVRVREPYASKDTSTVLAGYDVLVMSSIMLESYSLLTREALSAGLVVITGDNPGPGEVVEHGHNGLVVPRGDAGALADAMRSLVTDPLLLHRMRPESGTLQLRSLTEQAHGLEQHYRRLLEGPRPVRPTQVQRVLLLTGIDGAPLRYRGHLPAEGLQDVGVAMDIRHYRSPDAVELARTADAVVLYRVPATHQVLSLVEQVRARSGVPVLFDVDDLIVDPGLAGELDPILIAAGENLDLYWQGVRRYRTTLEACDGYIGSTEYLCERIGELTGMPTYRFANGVGRELARVSDVATRRPRTPGPLRLGYFSGTNTHNEDWAHIEGAVIRLMRDRPDVELWLGGLLETGPAMAEFGDRIHRLPFAPWYELPGLLRQLDVNVAPLSTGRTFNEAKSAIKWLEAALVGTPTVASPSQPFREVIDHGVTGMLADTPDEWYEALRTLLDDPVTRSSIAAAARDRALTRWSPAQQGYRYRDILLAAKRALDAGPRRRTSWPAEALDEPPMPVDLEYYGELSTDGPIRPAAQRGLRQLVSAYSDAARTMLAQDGLVATTKRAVRVAGRLRKQGLARLRR